MPPPNTGLRSPLPPASSEPEQSLTAAERGAGASAAGTAADATSPAPTAGCAPSGARSRPRALGLGLTLPRLSADRATSLPNYQGEPGQQGPHSAPASDAPLPASAMPQQAHARRKHPLGRLVLGHIPPSAPASAPVGTQDPNWVDEEREVDEVEAHPAPATPATPGGSEGLAQQRWQALKKRLVAARKTRTYGTKVRHGPDLTQELANGVLPVMLLKMGLERDDAGDRRVPVLLNHLQVRVTDSLEAGVQAGHAIFRIELCYGDGLTRWVVYREMRDFVNLYTHYRAAALRGRLGITKPEGLTLPSGGGEEGTLPPLPKLKHGMFWGRDTHHRRAAARALRAQLEQWLCQVCRQAALRPDANRLCKFFEISALALALSGRPGVQGKQGFLGVHSPISRKGSHPPVALRFLARKNQHWCMVRESYMIIAEQLGGLKVADVFLFDMDFRITRPKRIYRHPIHRPKADDGAETEAEEEEEDVGEVPNPGLQGQDVTALLTGGQFTNMQEGRDIDEQHAHGVSAHTFYLTNSHQKLKLVAHNERQMNQFVASLQDVARRNSYAGPNRFDSFSPIRLHVNATPLIDGRDYFWAVSKALARAKDRIMIHDWWLSPVRHSDALCEMYELLMVPSGAVPPPPRPAGLPPRHNSPSEG